MNKWPRVPNNVFILYGVGVNPIDTDRPDRKDI
jgi:hypothetical protein